MKTAAFLQFSYVWGQGHFRFTAPIRRFYADNGWCVRKVRLDDNPDLGDAVARADHVYIWNGSGAPGLRVARYAAESGTRLFCVEHGHFPQSKFIHVAEGGLFGRHPNRWVDWERELTQGEWEAFRKARASLERWRNPSREVLVPLQLPKDCTMRLFSNGYTNDYLVRGYFGRDKWIRHHPKSSFRHKWPNQVDNRPNLNEVLGTYERVTGINSTVLLEAALMGLEVTNLGQSYLDWCHHDHDVAAAAVLSNQIPINATDLTPWMRPHRGLEQLTEV